MPPHTKYEFAKCSACRYSVQSKVCRTCAIQSVPLFLTHELAIRSIESRGKSECNQNDSWCIYRVS